MIEVRGLTKQYGAVRAVDDLTFDVKPGIVTGFLGPNGAGKSTTMRMILGLDTPTAGAATMKNSGLSSIMRWHLTRSVAIALTGLAPPPQGPRARAPQRGTLARCGLSH